MVNELSDRVLGVIAQRPLRALFVTELQAGLGAPAPSAPELEQALATLAGDAVLVVDHCSPDPHLVGDLRVVALTGRPPVDPTVNADLVWTAWMREVLATHRCC